MASKWAFSVELVGKNFVLTEEATADNVLAARPVAAGSPAELAAYVKSRLNGMLPTKTK